MFTSVNEDGSAGATEVFASGWLDEETGEYYSRLVDVVQYLDGSLLVSAAGRYLPDPVRRRIRFKSKPGGRGGLAVPTRLSMTHMRATLVGTVFVAVMTLATPIAVAAGEVIAGREKAAPCAVCHGRDGIAIRPDAPNIAGQNAFYLREQLLAYRTGQRVHPQMNIVAQGLSDEDIDDLVAWYSSIKLVIQLPE